MSSIIFAILRRFGSVNFPVVHELSIAAVDGGVVLLFVVVVEELIGSVIVLNFPCITTAGFLLFTVKNIKNIKNKKKKDEKNKICNITKVNTFFYDVVDSIFKLGHILSCINSLERERTIHYANIVNRCARLFCGGRCNGFISLCRRRRRRLCIFRGHGVVRGCDRGRRRLRAGCTNSF